MKIENKRILFFGAGVIGSLYAGKLALSGQNVTILARGKRLEELQEKGLTLFSEKNGEEKLTLSVTFRYIKLKVNVHAYNKTKVL